jgi:hypothetical protein
MSSKTNSLDSLKWKTILEYNQLNAFAVSEDKLPDTTLTKFDDISTSTYKSSLGVLKSLSETLEKTKTNLQMMQNYAVKGIRANSDKKKATAYAQMRSLSAGIDSIVRSYKLEGTTLLTGRDYEFSFGTGAPLKMSLDNLASSYAPENARKDGIGLELATADKAGDLTVSYDHLNKMRNKLAGVSGIDITDAYTVKGNKTHAQLSDGQYQVHVTYNGPNSTVAIENLDGTVVEKKECDLSGSGQLDLAFKCGAGLSIELESWALDDKDIDKYDYKTNGPVSLYANLTYDTVVQHNLNDGTNKKPVSYSSAEVTSGGKLVGTTGSLAMTAEASSVSEGRTAMATGKYTAQVRYNGKQSSLWLYDSTGTLLSTVRDIDLTKDKAVTVNTDVGVSLTLDPTADFTSTNRNYTTTIDYTAKQDPYEVFDFDEYYDSIVKAIKLVDENISTVTDAQDALKAQYSITQSAVKMASSGGVTASSANNLMSVLARGSSGVSATNLFSALKPSGNSTPTVLSASTGSILSALSSSVSALSDVDPDILALYYR